MEIGLDGAYALPRHRQPITFLVDRHRMHQPAQVICTIAGAGHQIVAQEIVEPIRIELAGDHVAQECAAGLTYEKIRYLLRQRLVMSGEDAMNLAAGIEDHALGEHLMMDSTYALEHVTERPVAEVVQERGRQTDQSRLGGDVMRQT